MREFFLLLCGEGTDSTTMPAVVAPAVKVAPPARLRIPAVGIDATFEGPLGVNEDKTVEVPHSFTELGWYQYGPLPGEIGPAVILGHVDSYRGPAVFFNLKDTQPGDMIEIERTDGSRATFLITKLLKRQQSDFPTEAVYGDIDYAGLRLITCTGVYDHGTQVYSHNLIVFAKLVSEMPASSLSSTTTPTTP